MPSSPPSTPDWSDHLRGVGLVLHVVAVLLLALPSVGGLLSRSAWREPSVQEEFASWAGMLSSVGIQRTPEQLEEQLWSLATGYREVHRSLIAPARPYAVWLGTGQGWMMFPAPEQNPATLQIDVEIDGVWKPIYRARSAKYPWRRDFFDQDRIRTLMFHYTWPHLRRRGLFLDLQRWLGPWLAEDFPQATQARIRFWRQPTPTPEQSRAGTVPRGSYEAENRLQLQDYR